MASPSSIKHILSLLSEGAQGDTLNQLNTVLRLPSSKSTLNNLMHRNQLSMESSLIHIAIINNIFVKNKYSLSKKFVDAANDFYSANITEVDFQNLEESIQMINKRVSSDTNGLINSIISKGTCILYIFNIESHILYILELNKLWTRFINLARFYFF